MCEREAMLIMSRFAQDSFPVAADLKYIVVEIIAIRFYYFNGKIGKNL